MSFISGIISGSKLIKTIYILLKISCLFTRVIIIFDNIFVTALKICWCDQNIFGSNCWKSVAILDYLQKFSETFVGPSKNFEEPSDIFRRSEILGKSP